MSSPELEAAGIFEGLDRVAVGQSYTGATHGDPLRRRRQNVRRWARREAAKDARKEALLARFRHKSYDYPREKTRLYHVILDEYYAGEYPRKEKAFTGLGQRRDEALKQSILKARHKRFCEESRSGKGKVRTTQNHIGPVKDEATLMAEGKEGVKNKGLVFWQLKTQWGAVKWQSTARKAEMLYLLKEDGMDITPCLRYTARQITDAIKKWKKPREEEMKRLEEEEKAQQSEKKKSTRRKTRSRKRSRNEYEDEPSDDSSEKDTDVKHKSKAAKLSKDYEDEAYNNSAEEDIDLKSEPKVVELPTEDELQKLYHNNVATQSPRVVLVSFTRKPDESAAKDTPNEGLNTIKQVINDLYCDDDGEVRSCVPPNTDGEDEERPFAVEDIDEQGFQIWSEVPILVNVIAGVQKALMAKAAAAVGESKEFIATMVESFDDVKSVLQGEGVFVEMEIEVE